MDTTLGGESPETNNKKYFTLLAGVLLFLLLTAIVLSSCTPRMAAKIYDKNPVEAAAYCAGKFPVRERIVRGAPIVRQGKRDTLLLPGETLYADCSSEVIAALDEASRKRIAVKCPPTKYIHVTDTVVTHDSVILRDVAYEATLQNTANGLTVDKQRLENKVGNRNKWLAGSVIANLLLIIVLALGVSGRLSRIV